MDYVALGKNIRLRRQLLGLRQEDLAEKCLCSTSHIGAVEKARTIPSLETIIRIANALDVTVDELLYESIDQKEGIYLRDMERRIDKLPLSAKIKACEAMDKILSIIESINT